MSAPAPPAGTRALPRVVLWVVIAALVLLAGSCAAFRAGRSSVDAAPGASPSSTPTPTPTASTGSGDASPAPTVTVTATATVVARLPVTGGGSGSGSGSGGGSGSGSGTGSGTGSGNGSTGSSGSGSGTVVGGAGVPFTMTSTLGSSPLLLGESRTLTVTVSNANARPLTVASITTTPAVPAGSGCDASWLSVGDYSAALGPALVAPANGTASIGLPLTLVDLPTVNQNACQGVTFSIALAGTGSLS